MPEASAGERAKASSEQADLDAEELRELERAESTTPRMLLRTPHRGGIIGRLRALFGRRSS